jgi:hypothetical protein
MRMQDKIWMPGTRPGMTKEGRGQVKSRIAGVHEEWRH